MIGDPDVVRVGHRGHLVGRAVECAILDVLVGDVRDGLSGALLLVGEPGVGKSALLQHLGASATDLAITTVAGAESEIQLGYAALHRLLTPHMHRLDRLADPQRRALESTFGLSDGPPPDRFLVGLGALALLAEAAADHPVLCLVDDAHWLDQESLRVLGFVARRLHAEGVGLIFSARERTGDMTALDGLRTQQVGPLDPASARMLLAEHVGGELDSRVATRMIGETAANPLALLELAGELTADQLAGRSPLPRRLPVGRRIGAHFLAQVAAMPADTRTLLLLAAAASTDQPMTLWRAGSFLELTPDAAKPAVNQGILTTEPRIVFRHPLIRTAVYDGAHSTDRHRAHEALATVDEADGHWDQAAWHRGQSVTLPDEDIADRLDESAARAQRRGGYLMQAAYLTRAAELSPDVRRRALRHFAAAQAYLAAGEGVMAETLLDQATPSLDDAGMHVEVQQMRAALAVFFSRHKDAPALLLRAVETVDARDVPRIREMLFDAMQAAVVARQYTTGTTVDEVARVALLMTRDAAHQPTGNDLLLDGFATRIAVGYGAAVPLLRAAVAALFVDDVVPLVAIPSTILGWFAADDVWDEEGRRAMFERAVAIGRRQGALGAMRITLAGLTTSQAWAGEMDDAENSYVEAAEISALIGVPPPATTGVLLELRAWQGREAESRAVAASTALWGRQQGAAILETFALMGLTILELGLGRYAEALGWGVRIFDDDPPGFGNRILPDVVEAGMRGGNRDAAEAALARLTDRATICGTPWALGLLARSTALMADGAEAEHYYREAIALLGRTAVRTELARAHLLYGEWLRRKKRRREAQLQLRTAYDMFTAMGAVAFADRAGTERRATGVTLRDETLLTDPFDLTPQELQVARQAGAGATNAEIAGRLFITKSTVEYHLSKVFRKLGITSRRQLAEILRAAESPDATSSPV